MEVIVSYDNPRNIDEWNALCKECGNFVQTTMYSEISSFYGSQSIYIQVVDMDILVGGVKLNLNESRRLSFLSRSLSQFGEFVIKPNVNVSGICKILCYEFSSLSKKIKPTVISVKGFYGGKELLYKTDLYKCGETDFGVAYLNLDKSEEELLGNMHRTHRGKINKALSSGLSFSLSENANLLTNMIMETYSVQDKNGPNLNYIEHVVKISNKYDVSLLGVVKIGEDLLSANQTIFYGDTAYEFFAGNKKNNLGSGQFLKWQIIRMLKDLGCKKITFGQVAVDDSIKDAHFTSGITDFKMHFGCYVVDSCNRLYVVKPFYNWVWTILCKMFYMKK